MTNITNIQAETTLENKLEARTAASPIDDATRAVMQEAIEELAQTQITENAKQVGQKAPDFTLPTVDGNSEFSLAEALGAGPVVLVYYRGDWCPYCNLQLAEYESYREEIEALGAQIVALSPQTPENSKFATEENPFGYTVLTDPQNKVARSYGIVFELPKHINDLYTKYGFDIHIENGSEKPELPLAATYVITKEGLINYSFLEADYKKRAEPKAIIDALKAL